MAAESINAARYALPVPYPWYKTMRLKIESGLIALRPGLQKLGHRKNFAAGPALA